jgi:tellurite resistance protein TerC
VKKPGALAVHSVRETLTMFYSWLSREKFMQVSTFIWAGTIGLILALILVDLLTASRKAHDVKFKEAVATTLFYVSISIGFGLWVWSYFGSTYGTEFFAAYLVEYSLSIDNLFIFVIILAQFAVPTIYHQRVLLIGVMLALVFRAIFISIGAVAISAFSFTFAIFGAILIWTGIGLFKHWNEDPEPNDNFMVRTLRKRMSIIDEFHGSKLFIKVSGKRFATPMFLVIVAIGSTDLLFALDSIPATFGVTSQTFLVFTANAFALLGLRALYFLIKGLLDKLIYLSLGLSFILIFIGGKLMLTYAHEIFDGVPKIPTPVSLGVIATILLISTVASLIKSKQNPEMKAHPGRITGHKEEDKK